MALINAPGQAILSDIRYRARARVERLINGAPIRPAYPDPYLNSYVTTEELNAYINESYAELYELLVIQYSNYPFVSAYQFTTDGTTEQFDLPADLFKHLSTEWVGSPGSNLNNVTLKRFNLQSRNDYNYGSFIPPVYGLGNFSYSVMGNTLWLKPLPSGGQTVQVTYVPVPIPLADSGSINLNGVVAGDTLTINDIVFTAVAFGVTPTSVQFVVGGETASNLGDAGTAVSLTSTLNDHIVIGGKAGFLTATATPTTDTDSFVYFVLTNPAVVTWSTVNSNTALAQHLILTPNQGTGPLGTVITFTNALPVYAQCSEYLVVDAAIKITEKEKEDSTVLRKQKEDLVARYKLNFQNRDPGNPRTATDSRRSNMGPVGWGR